jgi:hypothetical protein
MLWLLQRIAKRLRERLTERQRLEKFNKEKPMNELWMNKVLCMHELHLILKTSAQEPRLISRSSQHPRTKAVLDLIPQWTGSRH